MTKAQNAQPLTKTMVQMSAQVGHMTGAMTAVSPLMNFQVARFQSTQIYFEDSFDESDSEDDNKDSGVVRADNPFSKLKGFFFLNVIL